MEFHLITLDDRERYDRALAQSPLFHDYQGSDLNFACLFAWRRHDRLECGALPDGTIVTRGERNGVGFYFPPIAATEPAFIAALSLLEGEALENNIPFLVRGMTASLVAIVGRSDRHDRIDSERNLFEYLYDAASLRTLSGTRYHAKRNFVNRFMKNGDHSFRPYRDADRGLVETMLHHWEARKLQAYEIQAILELLDFRAELSCFADLLFVGERLAAFAIGTLQGNVGITLFEKADTGVPGVYAAINQMFANAHYEGVPVVNRQEDLGIAELRKSKLSYHPIGFVEKYSLMRDHLSQAEIEELKSLYGEAFPASQNFTDYFFHNRYRSDNVVFHRIDGRIVSALHLVRRTVAIRHREFAVPFVAAAATLRTERGKGLMSTLLRQTLAELYNRKTALAAISSASDEYYRPFGFVTVCRSQDVRIVSPASDGRVLRVATRDDLPALDALYRRRMETYDVFVERRLDAWNDFYDEVAAAGGTIFLILENDEPIGYFSRFGDRVEELCLPADVAPTTMSALDGLTVAIEGGEGDGGRVMFRIVDAMRFLREYPYAPKAECRRRVRIVDDLFAQNNRSLEWIVEGGTVRIREIDDAEETLSIEELAAMAFQDGACPFGPSRTLVFDR
ncbi:MAG: GNAT family N-acetyltransferase [Candidatus Izemoplasmatales bacterium]